MELVLETAAQCRPIVGPLSVDQLQKELGDSLMGGLNSQFTWLIGGLNSHFTGLISGLNSQVHLYMPSKAQTVSEHTICVFLSPEATREYCLPNTGDAGTTAGFLPPGP